MVVVDIIADVYSHFARPVEKQLASFVDSPVASLMGLGVVVGVLVVAASEVAQGAFGQHSIPLASVLAQPVV